MTKENKDQKQPSKKITRRSFLAATAGTTAVATAGLALPLGIKTAHAVQNKNIRIVLVPGLTTDDFYITMNRGAQAAAEALGIKVDFQGAEEFEPVLQIPVLNAVIARRPDAILIAPTDKTQLITSLKKAHDAKIPVITVDTFIGNGKYQTGSGNADFPLSYIASDNIEGGRIAARAMARKVGERGSVYVSNVRPGISTTDQREEGFLDEMKNYSGIQILETQYNDDSSSTASSQFQAVLARNPNLSGVFGANLFSALGAANGVRAARKTGKIAVIAFDAPQSIVDNIKTDLVDIAIAQHPAEIGFYGVVTAYAHLNDQSVPTLIGTGYTVIDESNVDVPSIRKFIYSGSN